MRMAFKVERQVPLSLSLTVRSRKLLALRSLRLRSPVLGRLPFHRNMAPVVLDNQRLAFAYCLHIFELVLSSVDTWGCLICKLHRSHGLQPQE